MFVHHCVDQPKKNKKKVKKRVLKSTTPNVTHPTSLHTLPTNPARYISYLITNAKLKISRIQALSSFSKSSHRPLSYSSPNFLSPSSRNTLKLRRNENNLQAKHQHPTSSKYSVYSPPAHPSIYLESSRSHAEMGGFGIVLLLMGLMRPG